MQLTIGMLASRPVIAVEADTPALQALKLMAARHISCLVVVENAEPVGILTERDVVFTANWVVGQPSLRIREVMSKPVLTASADTTPDEACRLFRENDLRHLVVLGSQMELSGIFTLTDLVKVLRGAIFPEGCKVAELMSRWVLRVTPEVTARQALALMASHAISSVVVAKDGRTVGIFSERDVVPLISAGCDLACLPVAAVMSAPVVTISASASPCQAIDRMQEHAVRRLLVTDEDGALAGMLTQTDLGRVFEQQETADAPAQIEAAATGAGRSAGQSLQ